MSIFSKIFETAKTSINKIVDNVMLNPKRVEKQIEKFNDKIERIVREKPEIADIQPSMIIDNEKFKTLPKSQLKKELESIKNYTKKGMEKPITSKTGNTVTEWEKREVEKGVNIINAEREKELKRVRELEVTTRGEKTGIKRKEMESQRLNELRPKKFDFDKIRGGKEWDKFVESVKRLSSETERDKLVQQYKENYLKGLDNYGGYADDIKAIVEQLPAEIVVDIYYSEQDAEIDFYYEGLDGRQEPSNVLSTVKGIWEKALEDYNATLNG